MSILTSWRGLLLLSVTMGALELEGACSSVQLGIITYKEDEK